MSDGATGNGDRPISPNVMSLGGVRDGKYPHGNSLLVEGTEESLLIDPSLSLVGRDLLPRIDRPRPLARSGPRVERARPSVG